MLRPLTDGRKSQSSRNRTGAVSAATVTNEPWISNRPLRDSAQHRLTGNMQKIRPHADGHAEIRHGNRRRRIRLTPEDGSCCRNLPAPPDQWKFANPMTGLPWMAKRCSCRKYSRFAPPKRASTALPHTVERWVVSPPRRLCSLMFSSKFRSRWTDAAPLAFGRRVAAVRIHATLISPVNIVSPYQGKPRG